MTNASYFPHRGVQVISSVFNNTKSSDEEEEEEEDNQDATIRIIESNEESPVMNQGRKFYQEFSWMSPRWPSFSWSSSSPSTPATTANNTSPPPSVRQPLLSSSKDHTTPFSSTTEDEEEQFSGPMTRSRLRRLQQQNSKRKI